MRILFVARRYWPAVGGAEAFLRHLALRLGQEHQVRVLAQRVDDGPTDRLTDSLRPPPPFESFDDGPVRVDPLRIPAPRRTLMAPLLSQVVPGLRRYAYGRIRLPMAALYARVVAPIVAGAAGQADILHMWGSDLVCAATVRAGRLLARPVVVTPFAHRGQWGDDPASTTAYRAADRVFALLKTEAALYRDLGVSQERLAVGGVCSPGVPAGGGPRIRSHFGIAGPLVLFLGVRRPYKGFDVLLEAAPLVAARRQDVTFAFVGPGPRFAENGVGPRVLDIGAVDETARAAWLDAADLLCLPSEGEIFPVSILEAWSVGTPVVTSALPTLVELVGRAGGGTTAPRHPAAIADAIAGLLRNQARLQEMGEAGRSFWAAHYTVDAVASRHEHVYRQLTGEEVAGCVP